MTVSEFLTRTCRGMNFGFSGGVSRSSIEIILGEICRGASHTEAVVRHSISGPSFVANRSEPGCGPVGRGFGEIPSYQFPSPASISPRAYVARADRPLGHGE
jgi:hypothetical protein